MRTQAQQVVVETLESFQTTAKESFTKLLEQISELVTQVETEGIYSVVSHVILVQASPFISYNYLACVITRDSFILVTAITQFCMS